MKSFELITDIRNYCLQYADEGNALKYRRYFKEGLYDGYGLTQPRINLGAKILAGRYDNLAVVLAAAPDLLRSGKYEETGLLLLIVKNLRKQYTPEVFNRIAGWFEIGIHNWAHADTLGMMVLPDFLKRNILDIPDFQPWLSASNKFQRRTVPVTLIKSLKTHPDFTQLFHFVEPLMTDPEREVHQGMGWFLREAWKRKSTETETFLLKWKEEAPRLIIRYATEKMSPSERQRFRRSQRSMKK